MKWDKRMAQYSSGKRIVVADLSASCDYPHLHFARQRVSRQQAGDLQRSPRLPMPFYLRKTRSFFATQVTRLIKYQMVLGGQSRPPAETLARLIPRAFDRVYFFHHFSNPLFAGNIWSRKTKAHRLRWFLGHWYNGFAAGGEGEA